MRLKIKEANEPPLWRTSGGGSKIVCYIPSCSEESIFERAKIFGGVSNYLRYLIVSDFQSMGIDSERIENYVKEAYKNREPKKLKKIKIKPKEKAINKKKIDNKLKSENEFALKRLQEMGARK